MVGGAHDPSASSAHRPSSTGAGWPWLCAAGILVGCQAEAPAAPAAVLVRPAASGLQRSDPPFDGLDDLSTMVTTHAFRTAHPIGTYLAVVRVDAAANGYGTRGRGPMPEGARIVESLAPSGDPAAAPKIHYVMRKREPGFFAEGGDWEYAVTDGDGAVHARGRLRLCARCHAEAPREHLFEPARGPLSTR